MVAPMNISTSASSFGSGRKYFSISSALAVCAFVVDLSPRFVRFMWPFDVAVESGNYFRTSFKRRLGNPISWSLSIALHNISIIGENKHCWMNFIVSGIVEVWYALFSCCPQSWIANAFPLFEMWIYQSPFASFFVPRISYFTF